MGDESLVRQSAALVPDEAKTLPVMAGVKCLKRMELVSGLEPLTYALRNRCRVSTLCHCEHCNCNNRDTLTLFFRVPSYTVLSVKTGSNRFRTAA